MEIRLATMVRGLTVGAVYASALDLADNHKELNSAVTLMSTDIDGISSGIKAMNEMWINYLEVAFGIYLLATLVGKAAFLVAVPVLGMFCLALAYRGDCGSGINGVNLAS